LGPNSGKPGYKIGDTPGQFGENKGSSMPRSTGSLNEARVKYKKEGLDDATLKAMFLDQYNIELK
jgi:hypothetical protein